MLVIELEWVSNKLCPVKLVVAASNCVCVCVWFCGLNTHRGAFGQAFRARQVLHMINDHSYGFLPLGWLDRVEAA